MIATLLSSATSTISNRWRSISPGDRSSAASCSSPCRRRSAFSLSRHEGRMALSEPVRQAVRNFVPVLISRGAVQLTAYIDQWIASWLPTGAVAALANAQLLYTLPVSLFGVSISAAELPAHVGRRGPRRPASTRCARASTPACAASPSSSSPRRSRSPRSATSSPPRCCSAGVSRRGHALRLGHSRGLVDRADGLDDGAALFGGALRARRHEAAAAFRAGAAAWSRPCSATSCALVLPPQLGIGRDWGAAGLTASSGVVGWMEFALLRRSLNARIGRDRPAASYMARLWIAGLAGAASRGASGWRCRRSIRSSGAPRSCRPSAPAFLGAAVILALPVPGAAPALTSTAGVRPVLRRAAQCGCRRRARQTHRREHRLCLSGLRRRSADAHPSRDAGARDRRRRSSG